MRLYMWQNGINSDNKETTNTYFASTPTEDSVDNMEFSGSWVGGPGCVYQWRNWIGVDRTMTMKTSNLHVCIMEFYIQPSNLLVVPGKLSEVEPKQHSSGNGQLSTVPLI